MFVDPSQSSHLFGTQSNSLEGSFGDFSVQISQAPKNKPTSLDLLSTDDDDLFSIPTHIGKKKSDDLFAFTSNKKSIDSKSKTLFDDDLFSSSDKDLFSTTSTKKKASPKKSTSSLFDMDDDDLFSNSTKTKKESTSTKASVGSLFGEETHDTEETHSGSLFGFSFDDDKEKTPKQKPMDGPKPRPQLTPNIQNNLQNPPKLLTETQEAYIARTEAPGNWPELSTLTPISSSDPTLLEDPTTGKQYRITQGDSDQTTLASFGADEAYRNAGARVPPSKIYETSNGLIKLSEVPQTRPLSEILETANDMEKKSLLDQLGEHFALDALLGNTGLSTENIGVDSDGNVWRLNTNSTPSSDSPYPMECWSMRNSETSPDTHALFSSVSIYDIASQIESLHGNIEAISNAIPPDQRSLFAERLQQMGDISQQALEMQKDGFKPEYTDKMEMHRMGLREAGISAQMPQELTQEPGDFIVRDENGVEFDALRRKEGDPPGTPTLPNQIAGYMNENGGHPDAINTWLTFQGINSWSDGAQGMKYFLATQKDTPMEDYFWKDGQAKAQSCYKDLCRKNMGKPSDNGADNISNSFAIWHAATQELLANTDFRFNDREKHQVRVTRTEGFSTLRSSGISEYGTYPRYRMGPNESGSIFTSVKAYAGNNITTQEVPHHAITSCYLLGAPPDGIGSPFVNDKENEFLFIPQGIDVTYVSHKDHDIVGKQEQEPEH